MKKVIGDGQSAAPVRKNLYRGSVTQPDRRINYLPSGAYCKKRLWGKEWNSNRAGPSNLLWGPGAEARRFSRKSLLEEAKPSFPGGKGKFLAGMGDIYSDGKKF